MHSTYKNKFNLAGFYSRYNVLFQGNHFRGRYFYFSFCPFDDVFDINKIILKTFHTKKLLINVRGRSQTTLKGF